MFIYYNNRNVFILKNKHVSQIKFSYNLKLFSHRNNGDFVVRVIFTEEVYLYIG